MENMISSEKTYSQLYRTFIKSAKRIPYEQWEQFIARTNINQFKAKQLIYSANSLSTYSYFIISGLVMSYFERNGKKYVKWIRAENGYAYSIDTFGIDVDDPALKGENLMTLEDTLVVSISKQDLDWVSTNIPRINTAFSRYYMQYSNIYRRFEVNVGHAPENKYEKIQRATDFDLDRVPDVYLASYLDISLKDLKKVKELRKRAKN